MECSASLRIATEPVIAAAASFSAIRSELDAIETPAAAGLVIVVCDRVSRGRSSRDPQAPRPASAPRGRGG